MLFFLFKHLLCDEINGKIMLLNFNSFILGYINCRNEVGFVNMKLVNSLYCSELLIVY